jgi:hypothetical protein
MKALRRDRSVFALVFSLPLIAAIAHADEPQAPVSAWDYHDGEDLVRDANGFPLPGDAQIR